MQQAGWSNIWPPPPASASNQWREVWRHPRDPGSQPLQSGRAGQGTKRGIVLISIRAHCCSFSLHCTFLLYIWFFGAELIISDWSSLSCDVQWCTAPPNSSLGHITVALNRYKFNYSTEGNSTSTTHTNSKKNVMFFANIWRQQYDWQYMNAAMLLKHITHQRIKQMQQLNATHIGTYPRP